MDQRALETLEFQRIREILLIYATSSLGKSLASSIEPVADIHQILLWQSQVTELRRLLGDKSIPLGGIRDIRELLRYAEEPTSVLGCEGLLDIHSTLQAARHIKGYLSDLSDSYPNLADLGNKIIEFRDIEDEIYKSVDMQGTIKDNATPKLHGIRKEIVVKRARVKSKLQSLMRSAHLSQYLQGSTITIRKDRSVIPIKSRFRDKVPGIVRDQSDSGETLFIEPESISTDGDQLQELIQEEKQECFRILQEITSMIRRKADDIKKTLETLSFVDLVYAKSCFSRDFEMNEPILGERINVKKARHPLLMYERGWGKHPVDWEVSNTDPILPIDVRLGEDFDVLIITGPNTGGKTVTLKTIGLLTLMAQAGLHIPASEGSRLAIFDDIYADIGDEQSIIQNLSTFSAHLTQVVRILNHAGPKTLVLMDELGTGTDPQEGAALGTAVIDYLVEKGTLAIATTHLSALKTYAHAHPRIENASVEFDMQTLQPTYRLFIGTFGSSNALAIARRLGLPEQVISRANQLIEKEDSRIEELINSLQKLKAKTEDELEKASKEKEEYTELKEQYENMIKSFEEKPDSPKPLVIETKKAVETIPVTLANVKKGDAVRILSLNTEGQVVRKVIEKNRILVQTPLMKIEVRPEDLEFSISGNISMI